VIPQKHNARVLIGGVEATVISGELTADRAWTPHVQGTIEVSRHGAIGSGDELVIELTQRFGDYAFVSDLTADWCGPGRTLANLSAEICGPGRTLATLTAETITAGAWSSPVRASTGRTLTLGMQRSRETRDTITFDVASSEARVQDIVWWNVDVNAEGIPLTIDADTPARYVRAALDALKTRHILWSCDVLDRSTPTAIAPLTHTVEAGGSIFAIAQQLLTTARQRLYDAGDGILQIVDVPHSLGGSITISEANDTLLDWEITGVRTGLTLVRFAGTVTNPAARPFVTEATFPELNDPMEIFIDADALRPVQNGLLPGVTNPAAPYFDRIGLDRSPVKLTAIADFSVMPGSAITYTIPGSSPVNTIIDAITWRLEDSWQMDVWV
jgi:hypothetical protein